VQRRIIALFDGRVKGVHVDVQDAPERLLHPESVQFLRRNNL
jgi:hypothetical protein